MSGNTLPIGFSNRRWERHKNKGAVLALANTQEKWGKTDLAELIAVIEDALKVGWEMEKAPCVEKYWYISIMVTCGRPSP